LLLFNGGLVNIFGKKYCRQKKRLGTKKGRDPEKTNREHSSFLGKERRKNPFFWTKSGRKAEGGG